MFPLCPFRNAAVTAAFCCAWLFTSPSGFLAPPLSACVGCSCSGLKFYANSDVYDLSLFLYHLLYFYYTERCLILYIIVVNLDPNRPDRNHQDGLPLGCSLPLSLSGRCSSSSAWGLREEPHEDQQELGPRASGSSASPVAQSCAWCVVQKLVLAAVLGSSVPLGTSR